MHRSNRGPKIYIDNRECASDPNKSELDLLKDFFDLTLYPSSTMNGRGILPIPSSGALRCGHPA